MESAGSRPIRAAIRVTKSCASGGTVLAPLPKRLQVNRNHVQPIEEVLSEVALLDALLEVAVRRRDDADVQVPARGGADAADLAVLQEAKHLDLRHERELADFIEETRFPP